ncbi:hypothetical protein Bca4012_103618 [Brassica carinata]
MERGGSNLSDKGLNSVDRGSKATLPLTIPRRRFKSPAAILPAAGGNNNWRSERRSRTDLANDTRLWEPAPTEGRQSGGGHMHVPPSQTPHLTMSSARSTRQASLDLKEGVVTPLWFTDRIPLSALSSELAVRRPRNSRELFPVRPRPTRDGPPRRLAARAVRQQSTGSNWDLRAQPSEPILFPVTDPFCRLPLPTLFHRPEAVHLGDLMRYEYDRRERTRSSGFSRAAGMHRHHATRRCSSSRWTLPPLSRFQGGQAVKQKR